MDAKFQLNLDLKSGMVDIIFCVWWKGEVLTGVPMCLLIEQVSGQEFDTIRPLFRSYDELEMILKQAFILFDEFRSRIISGLEK